MDAIKLEMGKNDLFEMMKYNLHCTPHLCEAALDK